MVWVSTESRITAPYPAYQCTKFVRLLGVPSEAPRARAMITLRTKTSWPRNSPPRILRERLILIDTEYPGRARGDGALVAGVEQDRAGAAVLKGRRRAPLLVAIHCPIQESR